MSSHRSAESKDSEKKSHRKEYVDKDFELMLENEAKGVCVKRKETVVSALSLKSGGTYIPPGRLKIMQQEIRDKNSKEYQRIEWERLKKSINGLINRVNISNVTIIVRELMKENLIRGKGLLVRSLLAAQNFSTTYTNVYACLISIINTKFPQIGELLLKRLVIQFKRAYKRNDKKTCLVATKFIAHLVNQEVAHELVALEILTLLLENVTNDSVEIAVGLLKEVGAKLMKVCPKGFLSIFESLRSIVQEGQVDARIQYMIEVLYEIRKSKFAAFPTVEEGLDCVNEEEQVTHMILLDDELDAEDQLNVFRFDENFEENENKYRRIIKDILGEDSDESEEEESGSSDEDSDQEESDQEDENGEQAMIVDSTETNKIALRRTIYLTIQSSLSFEDCAHKLLRLQLKGKDIEELANMIIDCCAQQRTYLKFYGLLAQRFCTIDKQMALHFEALFKTCYDTIQRFETNKLRNVAKFFSHLLYTDSISWMALSVIRLTEDDTCSSSRVFIKILIQDLCEYMGINKLVARTRDQTLADAFEGLFPRDKPQNTRFSINFFTSINLGALTEDLREHLKNTSKKVSVL